MAVNVCPADRVQAPVELVWKLLMHPAGYGGFWDMTVERVEPEGLFSLAHHIDLRWLYEAYLRVRKTGATGVDGQTAADYSAHLGDNLRSLLERAPQAG